MSASVREPWRIIAGIGNPGAAYRRTYHNAGIIALHAVADALHGSGESLRWKRAKLFRYARCGKVVLVESLLFMNESGWAVAAALHRFREPPSRLLLLHDDSDIALGSFRIARERGAAGHHGVESVIASLKTKDFTRARIGVRKGQGKAGGFVLRPMTRGDALEIQRAVAEFTKKVIVND